MFSLIRSLSVLAVTLFGFMHPIYGQDLHSDLFTKEPENLNLLAALVCAGVGNIQEEQTFPAAVARHDFKFSRVTPGEIILSGECGQRLETDGQWAPGLSLKMTMDLRSFDQQAEPELSGNVGRWKFLFSFKPDENSQQIRLIGLKFWPHLEEGVSGLLPDYLRDKILAGLRKSTVAFLDLKVQWKQSSPPQSLRAEGLGGRWLLGFSAWERQGVLSVDAFPLTEYLLRGKGRIGGTDAHSVFIPQANGRVIGCSHFGDRPQSSFSEKTCGALADD